MNVREIECKGFTDFLRGNVWQAPSITNIIAVREGSDLALRVKKEQFDDRFFEVRGDSGFVRDLYASDGSAPDWNNELLGLYDSETGELYAAHSHCALRHLSPFDSLESLSGHTIEHALAPLRDAIWEEAAACVNDDPDYLMARRATDLAAQKSNGEPYVNPKDLSEMAEAGMTADEAEVLPVKTRFPIEATPQMLVDYLKDPKEAMYIYTKEYLETHELTIGKLLLARDTTAEAYREYIEEVGSEAFALDQKDHGVTLSECREQFTQEAAVRESDMPSPAKDDPEL